MGKWGKRLLGAAMVMVVAICGAVLTAGAAPTFSTAPKISAGGSHTIDT